MNASKHKKHWLCWKKSQLSNFKKKKMPFKLFEFLERFMIGAFFYNIANLRKLYQQVKFLFLWKSEK